MGEGADQVETLASTGFSRALLRAWSWGTCVRLFFESLESDVRAEKTNKFHFKVNSSVLSLNQTAFVPGRA